MPDFDPYYEWLGIPPKDQPAHHYRLLGVELFEEHRSAIDAAANRLMTYLQELSNGEDAALTHDTHLKLGFRALSVRARTVL